MTIEMEDENFKSLLRLHNSTNIVVKDLTTENKKLREENTFLSNEITMLRNKDRIRTNVMTKSLEDLNFKNNANLQRIQELESEIKTLKGEKNGNKH